MQYSEILSIASLRLDGRKYNEIRKIKYKLNIENILCDSSIYFEQGLNKVLILLKGPIELQSKGNDLLNEKVCFYSFFSQILSNSI